METIEPKKSSKKTVPLSKKKDVPFIVQQDHPALHEVAAPIPVKDITSLRIQKLIQGMKAALNAQDDGIGLAAPQIGISLRTFIVSGKVLLPPTERALATEGKKPRGPVPADLVFINPVIVKESKEKKWLDGEGCLSVRWYYGKVKRATRVTIRAYDEHGNLFERGSGGLMAHIFQHEIDHLDGILFIDKARDVQKLEREPDGHTHPVHVDDPKTHA